MGKKHVATAFLALITCLGLLGLVPGCARMTAFEPATISAPHATETAVAPIQSQLSSLNTPAPVPPQTAPAEPTTDRPCIWPVKDAPRVILSSYGYRGNRRGGPAGDFHRAVDIDAPPNAPVVAAAPGVVKEARTQSGYGKIVVVSHADGIESAYAHLNTIKVTPGQTVERGDTLGLAGRTGNASCTHVHYEIREQGKAVNPVDFLPMSDVHIERLASLTPPSKPTSTPKATSKSDKSTSTNTKKKTAPKTSTDSKAPAKKSSTASKSTTKSASVSKTASTPAKNTAVKPKTTTASSSSKAGTTTGNQPVVKKKTSTASAAKKSASSVPQKASSADKLKK